MNGWTVNINFTYDNSMDRNCCVVRSKVIQGQILKIGILNSDCCFGFFPKKYDCASILSFVLILPHFFK